MATHRVRLRSFRLTADARRCCEGYLKQTAPTLAQLLKATEGGSIEEIRPILESVNGTTGTFAGVACDILSFVEDNGSEKQTTKLLKAGNGFAEIYGLLFERLRPKLEKQIAAKQAKLDALLDQFVTLPIKLRQRAIERMEPMQDELDRLRGQLIDWREPYANLRDELAARRASLDTAKKAIGREGAGRQKADTLRGVINRIVCFYTHTQGRANNGKSILEKVEIEPISGDSVCFSAEGSLDAMCGSLTRASRSRSTELAFLAGGWRRVWSR